MLSDIFLKILLIWGLPLMSLLSSAISGRYVPQFGIRLSACFPPG